MSADLFTPLPLGSLELPNRVLMAPLTRCRAEEGHLPGPLMAEYYAQRAGACQIIAEATMAMVGHSAFWQEPGIHLACRATQPLRSCLSPCDAGC
jgi:N-ethylmaleimide reductase